MWLGKLQSGSAILELNLQKHENFPKSPITGTSYHRTAQWDWKIMKFQQKSSSEPQVVTRAVWDCSTTIYKAPSRDAFPRDSGNSCNSLSPTCSLEEKLTLMRRHCFDTSVKNSLLCTIIYRFKSSHISLQPKSFCKKTYFPLLYENLNIWKLWTLLYLNEGMVYYLPLNVEWSAMRQGWYKLRWLIGNNPKSSRIWDISSSQPKHWIFCINTRLVIKIPNTKMEKSNF